MKKSENILNYSQPSFYKFSRDSVELAILAAELESEKKPLSILEFFAGSGVISIEFQTRHSSVKDVTFVELQEEFKGHLEENSKMLTCNYNIHITNFKDFLNEKKYDVILANPPYFDPSRSRLGSDANRNICRFTMNFKFQDLIEKVESCLAAGGVAYFSHRDNLEELDSRITRMGDYEEVGLFRFCLDVD